MKLIQMFKADLDVAVAAYLKAELAAFQALAVRVNSVFTRPFGNDDNLMVTLTTGAGPNDATVEITLQTATAEYTAIISSIAGVVKMATTDIVFHPREWASTLDNFLALDASSPRENEYTRTAV